MEAPSGGIGIFINTGDGVTCMRLCTTGGKYGFAVQLHKKGMCAQEIYAQQATWINIGFFNEAPFTFDSRLFAFGSGASLHGVMFRTCQSIVRTNVCADDCRLAGIWADFCLECRLETVFAANNQGSGMLVLSSGGYVEVIHALLENNSRYGLEVDGSFENWNQFSGSSVNLSGQAKFHGNTLGGALATHAGYLHITDLTAA